MTFFGNFGFTNQMPGKSQKCFLEKNLCREKLLVKLMNATEPVVLDTNEFDNRKN